MAGHSSYYRSILLSSAFAVCVAACSAAAPNAEEIPEQKDVSVPRAEVVLAQSPQPAPVQNYYQLPAAVQNFYIDGSASLRCATIDGQGTNSPDIAGSVRELNTTLSRFPLGHAAVLDLRKSGTILCFEPNELAGDGHGFSRQAEYRRELNMFRLTNTDVGQVMHEWKHKKDDINFNSYIYSPRSTILMLRFAEAGAYGFEVMARHDALTYGVHVPAYPAGSTLAQVEKAYLDTLGRGASKEQAWRAAFDTSFRNGMLNTYTDHVLAAYEQASTLPWLAQNPDFAKTQVSDAQLIRIALPPGWAADAFRRTGSSDVSKNLDYVGHDLRQEERLQALERSLERKPQTGTGTSPSPFN